MLKKFLVIENQSLFQKIPQIREKPEKGHRKSTHIKRMPFPLNKSIPLQSDNINIL